MSVTPYVGPAGDWSDLGDVGLEDVGAADISMPRLQINHDEATFKDSGSGEDLGSKLMVVLLGIAKQRIMWDSQVDDGDRPQCKSPDFKIGFPQMRKDIPVRKQFPWDKSNFSESDFVPNDEGFIALPCDSCVFKEWGKDKSKPPCSEQFTFPLYYVAPDGTLKPGLFSTQRSGIKPARTYLGTFKTAGQPLFTVYTELALRAESRGRNNYAVPTFRKGESTDPSQWATWATSYREVRDWLQQPPTRREEDDAKETSRPKPASAATATALKEDDPWSAPAEAKPIEDDELPF